MDKSGRRKFVKRLLMAGGLLAMPDAIIKASATTDSTQPGGVKNSGIDIRNIRQSARDAFYKKEYAVAEELYRQLIALQPQAIEGYDRLAKVYLAQQKSVEACRLRLSGITLNPDSIVFSERYAKELIRIAVGDLRAGRIIASEIDSVSLFETAITLYCTIIEIAPEKKYLRFGLLDAVNDLKTFNEIRKEDHKISAALQQKVNNLTIQYLEEWDQRQNPGKISALPNNDGSKERRVLYFEKEQKERLESILKHKCQREVEYFDLMHPKNGIKPRSIYVVPKEVPLVSGPLIERLRDDARWTQDYGQLCKATKAVYEQSPRFWNTIGYADALRLKKSDVDGAIALYRQAEKKLPTTMPFKKICAVYCGWAKCLFEKGNYTEGRLKLYHALDLMNGVSANALHMIIHYANSYRMENQVQQAENILVALARKHNLTDWTSDMSDPVCKFIFPNPQTDGRILFMQQIQPRKISEVTLLPVCYSLARLYKSTGNAERLSAMRRKIVEIDLESSFIAGLNAES